MEIQVEMSKYLLRVFWITNVKTFINFHLKGEEEYMELLGKETVNDVQLDETEANQNGFYFQWKHL
jgi:hypothetical protein